MKNLKNQKGRSMIEMLGVLAIIGVLSVGGIAGYSKAMQKYRINKTIEQITLIAGNVRAFFAPQRSYDGLNNDTVIKKAKLVPDEMWDYYSYPVDAFGEGIYFGSIKKGDSDSNENQAFSISFGGDIAMSEEACIELMTQDWSAAQVSLIRMDGASMGEYYFKPPLNIDDAATYCPKVIADKPDCGISLYFDIDVNSSYWQGKINPSS